MKVETKTKTVRAWNGAGDVLCRPRDSPARAGHRGSETGCHGTMSMKMVQAPDWRPDPSAGLGGSAWIGSARGRSVILNRGKLYGRKAGPHAKVPRVVRSPRSTKKTILSVKPHLQACCPASGQRRRHQDLFRYQTCSGHHHFYLENKSRKRTGRHSGPDLVLQGNRCRKLGPTATRSPGSNMVVRAAGKKG